MGSTSVLHSACLLFCMDSDIWPFIKSPPPTGCCRKPTVDCRFRLHCIHCLQVTWIYGCSVCALFTNTSVVSSHWVFDNLIYYKLHNWIEISSVKDFILSHHLHGMSLRGESNFKSLSFFVLYQWYITTLLQRPLNMKLSLLPSSRQKYTKELFPSIHPSIFYCLSC